MLTRLTLALLLLILFPCTSVQAALININTAGIEELDTLPGIGPSKAAAIVSYREEHGIFTTTADIQNVSGIGASTYAEIAPLITVGNGGASTPPSSSASSPATISSVGSAPSQTSTSVPSSFVVDAGGDIDGFIEVPLLFEAHMKSKGTNSVTYVWSFGDGSQGTGMKTDKTYHYAGTYAVTVIASDGASTARDDLTVTVRKAQVALSAVTTDGITLTNSGNERVDLSGWRLSAGPASFRIPNGTILLPRTSVLMPFAITALPLAFDSALAYPTGLIASRYGDIVTQTTSTPAAVAYEVSTEQPQPPTERYNKVQEVETIYSEELSKSNDDIEAVEAPREMPSALSRGAPVAVVSAALPQKEAPEQKGKGIFSSPWTYALIGVVVVAGAAFMLL